MPREEFARLVSPTLKPSGPPALLHQADPSGLLCAWRIDMFLCRHTLWHTRWDPTIVMTTYNNSDILMVPYEDVPDEDKDVISKAIEEFQNKCLLSYTKSRNNKVVEKYPLPRVLLHGQSYIDEAEDRHFFVEAVNKYVHDAILNHNTVFLTTFHNTMKEVFHGYPIDQVGPVTTIFHIH